MSNFLGYVAIVLFSFVVGFFAASSVVLLVTRIPLDAAALIVFNLAIFWAAWRVGGYFGGRKQDK